MLNFNKKKYVSFDNLKSFNGLLQSSLKEKLDGYKSEVDTKVQKKFNELSGKVQTDSEVIDARKGEASLRAKIDVVDEGIKNVSSQLAHIKNINYVNVKDYGAIGDWNSHPAYEKYSSLDELKKDYPLATSLNDEIDSLAIEKAISNNFNEIYIPYGGYKLNKKIVLNTNQRIFGGGRNITMLDVVSDIDCLFYVDGHNVIIDNLRITSNNFNSGVAGCTSLRTSAIKVNQKTHLKFNDLHIVGFNIGIEYGENCWCVYNDRLRIQNCNYGVKANGEFNNITFNQCSITYCDICGFIGHGSNILFNGCDIERSNKGIIKTNGGDINIKNSYFELNKNGNISIEWSNKDVESVIIEGNSFFTQEYGEEMIKYHTGANRQIIIKNNNFRSYNINAGTKVSCLIPTNNTLAKPIFEDNVFTSDYVIGVNINKINFKDYYKNGNRLEYSNNITSDLTEEKPSLRGSFTNGEKVTLPLFKDRYDLNKCYKLLFHINNPVDGQYMTLDTTNHSIIGENKILPNQIYSIYFNRVINGKEEIILAKG